VNVSDARGTYRVLTSEKLDLHFAMDLTMQPTASLADYVLPAAGWLERPNLRTDWGFSNLYQCTDAAVEPLCERRDDYWLWAQLGKRLGMAEEWPETLEGMFDLFLEGTGMNFRGHLEKNIENGFTFGLLRRGTGPTSRQDLPPTRERSSFPLHPRKAGIRSLLRLRRASPFALFHPGAGQGLSPHPDKRLQGAGVLAFEL